MMHDALARDSWPGVCSLAFNRLGLFLLVYSPLSVYTIIIPTHSMYFLSSLGCHYAGAAGV